MGAESDPPVVSIAPDTLAYLIGNILKQNDSTSLNELPQAAKDDVNAWVGLAGPQQGPIADSKDVNAKYDAYLDYVDNNPQASIEQTAKYKAALLLTKE